MCQIFTAELCTQTDLVSFFQYLFFQFDITESTAKFISRSRQIIVEVSRRQFHCQQVLLSRSTADHKSDMIRRTSGSSQSLHFFHQERNQCTRVQNCFCFLIQICFVGRTTTFRYAEEFVFHAFGSFDVNLCRQVTFCIYLIIHIQRRILRVTQVFFGICFVNTQ